MLRIQSAAARAFASSRLAAARAHPRSISSCAAPSHVLRAQQFSRMASSSAGGCRGAAVPSAAPLRAQPFLLRGGKPPLPARPLARAFSSPAGGGGASHLERLYTTRTRLLALLRTANENRFVILTIGGALVAMYGFYRVTVKTMSFLLHVSDATIFNLGFATGIVAAAAVVAAAFATHRLTSLSVDGLKRAALLAAQQDYRVAQKLGSQYFEARPTFRAYTFETLHDAVFGSERRARSSYYQVPARRCRLMFQVQGSVHDGVLAVEGFKRSGKYEIEAMALYVTDTGETVALRGDEAVGRHALFEDVLALKTQAKREREEHMEDVDPLR